ncbi:hypothetical protein AWU67_06675 [Microterricola viridarii]|uniref:Uncharacterized protein n=2 Tax=Microterricola viridarii TaxID=412690 RepID=A0A0X8E3W6_9MICO|nr:hypothetical protein AWU67_06675 [Microterricola viridarii]
MRGARASTAHAREFCAERGYSFRASLLNPPISGLLFRNPKNVVMRDVVDALSTDAPFLYARVSARGRPLRRLKLIMLPLPRPLPNMVLLSTTGNVLKRLGIALQESQRLGVEGDFHSVFTLYCPSAYEVDALYVFSPDLLGRIMDAAAGCDLEIVDNRLLIYAPAHAFSKPGQLAALVGLVAHLHEKFDRQTRRYRDERGSDAALEDPFLRAQLTATETRSEHGHVVGTHGRRLRTRTTAAQKAGIALAVILALCAAGYWAGMVVTALFGAG